MVVDHLGTELDHVERSARGALGSGRLLAPAGSNHRPHVHWLPRESRGRLGYYGPFLVIASTANAPGG